MAMRAESAGRRGGGRGRSWRRALDRPFAVVCLDWEAAADGGDEAVAAVRSRLERLAALGVDVAVLAAGDVHAVDGRLQARPVVEGRLFLFLSDGAEVYVVGPHGPRLLERRVATAAEEAALDAAVAELRERLEASGLEALATTPGRGQRALVLPAVATDRPGMVAIQPPPDEVAAALARAGFSGVAALVAHARGVCRAAGVPQARVWFDGRCLRLGVTAAADAVRSVARLLVDGRGRRPADVLVVGDRLLRVPVGAAGGRGPVVPELRAATYVSVAPAADGLPPQVLHAGGGVARLLEVLHDQLARREMVALRGFPEPVADPAWRLDVDWFDPYREREVETWLTVANGLTGTRGAVEEGTAVSTPATFVAGVFGDGTGDPVFRQPVPAPDWTGLRLVARGSVVTLYNGEIVEHRRVLDMRHGLVFRYWRQRLRTGRTVRIRSVRFASLDDRQLLVQRAEATPEDFSGRLVWQGALGLSHAGGPAREVVVEALEEPPGLLVRTRGRRGGGHVLAATLRPAPGSPVARTVEQGRDVVAGRLEPGDPATVDRFAAVAAARSGVPSPEGARSAVRRAEALGFEELLRRHAAAWEAVWQRADLDLRGDPDDQLALRFAIFHLVSSAHPDKDTVSIGARGLGGMSYYLHVFWDTEVFVLPFFIYTQPETARTLLSYRYRNLPGAREKARQLGHRGALFPWESADRGTETTPPYVYGPDGGKIPILSGLMEHHISADIAWAVWEYWQATADDAFMAAKGVELLLETARFWASRAVPDEAGRYHIPVVVGPDEYHEGVDDNAFTNVMARWNIRRALEAWEWLRRVDEPYADELAARLGLSETERFQWRRVADHLVDNFDPASGLFEQFAGFYDLAEVPLEKLRPRPLAADLLLGRDVTLHSKVVKQADVVMLCHLLADEVDERVTRANYDYYEPITTHGSSLSPGIHAAVAARLGDLGEAVEYFKMAAAIDLADNMGNAAAGLHIATMGGLWQAAVWGFCGVRRRGRALTLDPHLPPRWRRVRLPLRFRGSEVHLDLRRRRDGDEAGITVHRAPCRFLLDGEERLLACGEHRLRRRHGQPWEEVRP